MTTRAETAGDERTTAGESPVVRFREVGKVYDDEGLRVTAIRYVSSNFGAARSERGSFPQRLSSIVQLTLYP